MIHEIRMANFFCFLDEQRVDLRISGKATNSSRFRHSNSDPDVRLPCVIALFGANGSGKSTALRAVKSLVDFATQSFDLPVAAPIPYFSAHLSSKGRSSTTRLEAIFDALWLGEYQRATFHYIVEVENKGSQAVAVHHESLHFTMPGGKKRRYFVRNGNEIIPGEPLGISRGDTRLKSVRANCSVIAALAKFNHEPATRIWTDLSRVQTNFAGHTRFQADQQALMQYYANNRLVLDALNREIQRIDIGIRGMEIQDTHRGPMAFFHHDGLDAPVLYDNESRGTQHFLAMFPQIFFVLSNGHVALLDEVDADMHPVLVPELFRWFQDKDRNPHCGQLIVTAHNAALLDDLEKEEVFFTEKHDGKATIFAAQDIKGLRREPSLSKKYLGGFLGALPRIG